MFLNISNHPSAMWTADQRDAASAYGDIVDLPFPEVSPVLSRQEVQALADEFTDIILVSKPNIILCQGEYTLTYALVTNLTAQGIKVVAACSDRASEEKVLSDGSTERKMTFKFVQFREYE